MKTLIKITILFALMTQISHASYVYYTLSNGGMFEQIMSWVFAVSLETSIFIFTMAGRRNTAMFFGIISWSVNILSYWFEAGFTQKFVAMNVISIIIPITIFFYSELIKSEKRAYVKKVTKVNKKPNLKK
jgi:hypothetical protein